MSWFAKLLLIATSLSPLLGAVAVNKYANGDPYWWSWILVTVLLGLICWLLLFYLSRSLSKNTFTIGEFESNDKEILAFLLTYLLPFISSDKLSFTGEWLTGVYIILIILVVLMHADAFHFNPVMAILGFHFYSVKDGDGLSYLLITRDPIRRPGKAIRTVSLAHNIQLQVKEQDD